MVNYTPRDLAFAHQRQLAREDSDRRKEARAKGYRGVFTRAELAAKAVRAEREQQAQH